MSFFVPSSMFARQFAGVRPFFGHQFALHRIAQAPRQRSLITQAAAAARSAPRNASLPFLFTAAGIAGVGLGVSAFAKPKIHCDTPSLPTPPPPAPAPPASSVNLYELSFGTACGVCAGVFIKKGTKAIAFLLGGVFVLLQYLGSASVIRVDWAKMGSRFENLFYNVDPITGTKRAPSVYSMWSAMIEFLTVNFQQRASFIAGLGLGLRVG